MNGINADEKESASFHLRLSTVTGGPIMASTDRRTPVLDGEFWEAAGGVDAWRRLHGREDPIQMVRLLRRCTYAGRPFGEEEFVREMEERFHRRWRRSGFELAVTGAGEGEGDGALCPLRGFGDPCLGRTSLK